MYEIRPETLKTFVEDSNIKLPRFQRKQTWDSKKNFELCISIFKEYPVGVTILNVEKNDVSTTRWLLDGRQRRNALSQFYNDPENVYDWAKKYIGFSNSDQLHELEEKFWNKISEYLEDEEFDKVDNQINWEELDELDEISNDSQENEVYDKSLSGLNLLLHIIKLTHNKTKISNGFTRPFDFSEYTISLPYFDSESGNKKLNSRKVKSFIKEFKNYCNDEGLNNADQISFEKFVFYRLQVKTEQAEKLKLVLKRNWDSIYERIDILDKIVTLYTNSKIGLIEVKDLKSTDSQKIFNIINSKGTTLTAVEILSAKPSWNKLIKSPTEKQKIATKNLYETILVKHEGVVKWDLAATILERLDFAKLFFKNFSDNKTDFEKKLTIGFKLLSGIIEKGVKKEDIDLLGNNLKFNWEIHYEELINDLNSVHKIILGSSYFKFLTTYRFTLMSHLSDAIALNFTILMYLDWIRKGKPVANESAKQVQKNAFILLDSLIFEYVTRQWRGSSDGIISRNIVNFDLQLDILKPVEKQKWKFLISEILEENKILGENISKSILEPILLHYYAMKELQAPETNYSLEIDHIIPQSLFKSSTIENKDYVQHNLFNLCVLPKDENISKSKKRLIEITDSWLKNQITKFTLIEDNDFVKYSDLKNLEDLKELRGNDIIKVFEVNRDKILLN
ncbi:DUF262 domain-containing protein [Myroides odoratus]|uniref:DUF262 domain-containing protein n=1 Tax=Myroides odoratus TaxID=256 RepID=UPI0007661147|nr:DUF262 domain-containing protein [Myroides odoratus]